MNRETIRLRVKAFSKLGKFCKGTGRVIPAEILPKIINDERYKSLCSVYGGIPVMMYETPEELDDDLQHHKISPENIVGVIKDITTWEDGYFDVDFYNGALPPEILDDSHMKISSAMLAHVKMGENSPIIDPDDEVKMAFFYLQFK